MPRDKQRRIKGQMGDSKLRKNLRSHSIKLSFKIAKLPCKVSVLKMLKGLINRKLLEIYPIY